MDGFKVDTIDVGAWARLSVIEASTYTQRWTESTVGGGQHQRIACNTRRKKAPGTESHSKAKGAERSLVRRFCPSHGQTFRNPVVRLADHPPGTRKTESIQVQKYIALTTTRRGRLVAFTIGHASSHLRLPRLNVRVSPEKIGGVIFVLEGD
jgi:hypothetical protein